MYSNIDIKAYINTIKEQARAGGIPIIKDGTLRQLIQIIGCLCPQKILEIGTAVGYSGICMLSAAGGENARLYTVEIDECRARVAGRNFKGAGYTDRVHLHLGDAAEIVPLITGSYDLIFLDGPKGQYKNMLPYLKALLSPGGCLFCDNVLYRGLVDGRQRLRKKRLTIVDNLQAFIDDVFSDPGLKSFISFEDDGSLISIREQ